MNKTVIAIALICISGGAWLYLDCLNRQEQGANEKIHMGIEQARAEAKKRLSTKAGFELLLRTNLSNCQAAAEKAKSDYVNLMQEIMPRKRGQIVIPPTISVGIEATLASGQAECQQIYEKQLKDGV